MEQGWIKLHRKILENPIVSKPNYLALWVVLLLKANHKEKKMIWNNQLIIVKEGQLITGRDSLSKQTGIHRSSIERILQYLENEHQIEQQKTTKFRLITIVNWETHQGKDSTLSNKRATNEQQASTNKNEKKDKNEKKINTDETSSSEIPLLIKSFESINPASKRFYGNTTQRKACQDLIENYTLERVQNVIEKTLPRTNSIPYFPSITTPLQLFEKWATLESKIKQYQSEKLSTKEKYKII